jgi:hypothetical protein
MSGVLCEGRFEVAEFLSRNYGIRQNKTGGTNV